MAEAAIEAMKPGVFDEPLKPLDVTRPRWRGDDPSCERR